MALAIGPLIESAVVLLDARVVDLVDTQVSEACALTACEFESRLGHHMSVNELQKWLSEVRF